jgi:hypothetical protein
MVNVNHCNTLHRELTRDGITVTIPLTSMRVLRNSFLPILVSPISSKSFTSHRRNPKGVTPFSIGNKYSRQTNQWHFVLTRESLAVLVIHSLWTKPLEKILIRHGTAKHHTMCGWRYIRRISTLGYKSKLLLKWCIWHLVLLYKSMPSIILYKLKPVINGWRFYSYIHLHYDNLYSVVVQLATIKCIDKIYKKSTFMHDLIGLTID